MLKSYVIFLTESIVGIVELLLGFRIVLKLLGARPAAPFVSWIYNTSAPLLAPFEDMFPTTSLGGSFTLEASALFALLAYACAGYLLETLIHSAKSSK